MFLFITKCTNSASVIDKAPLAINISTAQTLIIWQSAECNDKQTVNPFYQKHPELMYEAGENNAQLQIYDYCSS